MNPFRCTARVQITLELDSGSTWGGDCAMEQVYKQAREGAMGRLREVLRPIDIKIIGDIKVTAIMTDDPK